MCKALLDSLRHAVQKEVLHYLYVWQISYFTGFSYVIQQILAHTATPYSPHDYAYTVLRLYVTTVPIESLQLSKNLSNTSIYWPPPYESALPSTVSSFYYSKLIFGASVIPRPHPWREKRVWWTLAESSVLVLSCTPTGNAKLRSDWPTQMCSCSACSKLVIWPCQSCDLIGVWKFLRAYTSHVAFQW